MNQTADDDRCELDPNKICDNCFRCLEPAAGQEYAKIEISAVYTGDDYIVEDHEMGFDSESDCARNPVVLRAHTLNGLKAKRRF